MQKVHNDLAQTQLGFDGVPVHQSTFARDALNPITESRVAAHLGAGLRLRRLTSNFSLDANSVEAVLDPRGDLRDGRAPATDPGARANLREAVRRIEYCRTASGRSEPDAALDNWRGLVNGRWSLVDHFDADGKRYIVALKNDPAHPDPRGLTQGERQIAEYIGMGYTTKEIAYLLGVSDAAVTNASARIQNKLALSSRTARRRQLLSNGERTANFPTSNGRRICGANEPRWTELIDARDETRG